MSQIISLVHAIQTAIRDGRVTKRALSRAAGLPETTMIGVERPDWNPKLQTLQALERGLRLCEEGDRRSRRAPFGPARAA